MIKSEAIKLKKYLIIYGKYYLVTALYLFDPSNNIVLCIFSIWQIAVTIATNNKYIIKKDSSYCSIKSVRYKLTASHLQLARVKTPGGGSQVQKPLGEFPGNSTVSSQILNIVNICNE